MADILAEFEAEARRLAEPAITALAGPPAAQNLILEIPQGGQADLALACFPLAKTLHQNPAQIAETLADAIRPRLAAASLVDRVEPAGGYLNFFIHKPRLVQQIIPLAVAQGRAYGALPAKNQRLILEHTSANPTGPLHVGRARNPIIGDTLARILRKAGWTVETQYYLDDVGKQVAILCWGRTHLGDNGFPPPENPKPDHVYVRHYQEANKRMEENPEAAAQIQRLILQSEEADAATLEKFEAAYRPILDGMMQSMRQLGVTFDSTVKESTFIQNGDTARIIERLQTLPQSRQEDDGALWLDLATYGIAGKTQRFVYRRRDGSSLYATRDVAYHFWKAQRADRLVNVLGEDHKLQAQQVRISLQLLGATTLPEVIFYAFVSLPEGKMSTRKSRVVYLDDLLDEAIERAYDEVKKRRADELDDDHMRRIAHAVGIGAVRYNIIRVQPEKQITFKWEEALNFEGASAPFLQYAYARCASILRKTEKAPGQDADLSVLAHPSEHALAHQIARLPRVVDGAARLDAPHFLATYAQELASALSAFYRDCPVLTAESDTLRGARTHLVEAARNTLGATLDLLGVPVLEEM